MELTKTKTEYDTYDIRLSNEDSELQISVALNGDLYMSLSNGETLNKGYFNDYRWIDITKDDFSVYNAFNNLYNDILDSKDNTDIVDEDDNIVWTSDDGIEDEEDTMVIMQYPDSYHLIFIRNNNCGEECSYKHKSSKKIVIRFCSSGSRYKKCVSSFMNMYKELCDIKEDLVLKKIKK